jgi:hypothetical protein
VPVANVQCSSNSLEKRYTVVDELGPKPLHVPPLAELGPIPCPWIF